MTSAAASHPTPAEERREPPFPSTAVEEPLRLLSKLVRAHQLYLPNNPIYHRALETTRAGFAALWQQAEEVALTVTETEFRWEGVPVLVEPEKSSDSLPWTFYKDGIRELRMLQGFEQDELVALLDILQRVRKASPEEDDLLTMLWEKDFLGLRYQYVDLSVDAAAPLDGIAGEQPPHVDPRQVAEAPEEKLHARPEGIVSMADFDTALYFLEEREIEYLRGEVRKEYQDDLRRNVSAILLDIFEQQAAPDVRTEILSILDNLMLHLLSAAQFSAVAYLLRETAQASQRARELQAEHRQRLAALPDRLSEPAALSQLLESLDEAQELPQQSDLNELFEQLRPTALGSVLSWLGRTQNVRLRTLLEIAAARLASQNTAELVKLIGSSDKAVAAEAMRRAGSLRSAAAVAPLGRAMADADAAVRLAAVQALGEIGTAGALQQLEKVTDDADRDVRVAGVRALLQRGHRPALPRIEAAVKGKAIREADLTEKMAMFEAYGALCGDAGIPLLDGILNGKGFLGRREDPEMRACAAMALGRVNSDRAHDVLLRASGEKEVLVRNAVNRALRSGG